MAYIINTKNEIDRFTPKSGAKFDFSEIQKAVGGYVQFLYFPTSNEAKGQKVMAINEDGKNLGLQFNGLATRVAQAHNLIFFGDFIVGNAVIINIDKEINEED